MKPAHVVAASEYLYGPESLGATLPGETTVVHALDDGVVQIPVPLNTSPFTPGKLSTELAMSSSVIALPNGIHVVGIAASLTELNYEYLLEHEPSEVGHPGRSLMWGLASVQATRRALAKVDNPR